MIIYLIRHGKTKGNLEGRYIGRTDESLCEAGRENLKKYQYPQVEMVFTSPMKRCMQTAETIYPGQQYQCIEEFRESDFGAFEGHTYKELSGDVRYQAWIDSGGTLPFPGLVIFRLAFQIQHIAFPIFHLEIIVLPLRSCIFLHQVHDRSTMYDKCNL